MFQCCPVIRLPSTWQQVNFGADPLTQHGTDPSFICLAAAAWSVLTNSEWDLPSTIYVICWESDSDVSCLGVQTFGWYKNCSLQKYNKSDYTSIPVFILCIQSWITSTPPREHYMLIFLRILPDPLSFFQIIFHTALYSCFFESLFFFDETWSFPGQCSPFSCHVWKCDFMRDDYFQPRRESSSAGRHSDIEYHHKGMDPCPQIDWMRPTRLRRGNQTVAYPATWWCYQNQICPLKDRPRRGNLTTCWQNTFYFEWQGNFQCIRDPICQTLYWQWARLKAILVMFHCGCNRVWTGRCRLIKGGIIACVY